MQAMQSREIAIIGVSTELPSGNYADVNLDHALFFQFLMDGGQAYERIPASRMNIDSWYGNGIGLIHTKHGAFLKDIDMFDNTEFGMSLRDARALAPATRKLLEACFLALLDSGIDYRARNVGCYTSGTSFDITTVTEPDEFEPRGSFGGYPSMIANRVSFHLDLLGPSVPTDTACSSSLTALHLAVKAVADGECEAAVVGGCQLNHRFIDWITYSQGSILSRDGRCKPFDASADGFARAEGCVAVVLKPLDDAIRDGDHIYGTILGTAINSGGGGAPPGAPVAEAQRNAMRQAFACAGKNPKDVDYIELHATGTAKGDPTEANWVGEEFSRDRSRELLIGSVKGNIGHTEIAAFLASLSKVLSIFEHHIIPANVNFKIPNPAIKWTEYGLRVPQEPTCLPSINGDKPLIAIAGAGIGGASGHVVLEGPSSRPFFVPLDTDSRPMSFILLMCGGLTPRSATEFSESVKQLVEETVQGADLWSLSMVLGRRIRQMTWRSYAVLERGLTLSFSTPQYVPRKPNPVVFIFSGQGPQHKDMGRHLFSVFPVFRHSVLEMDAIFRRLTGKSIIHDWGLFDGHFLEPFPNVWPIALSLPAIAIFQIALFDLLESLGVKPDTLCGHSAGETAVLYASGAASKTMAIELAIIRGECFSVLENLGGAMAALSCGAEEAETLLTQYRTQSSPTVVEIACYNSPTAVALAGDGDAVDHVLLLAKNQGIAGTKLRTGVPIHSSLMDACRGEYLRRLTDLFSRYPGQKTPKIPTYSTLTGKIFTGSYDAAYFWSNTRSQVRFTDALHNITSGQSANFSFVEIAPHPVLLPYISTMVTSACAVLPVVRRPMLTDGGRVPLSEYRDMLEFCGKLATIGYNAIDFRALNGITQYNSKIPLPRYPFLKKRISLYSDTPWLAKQMASRPGPVNHSHLKFSRDTHPILAEHIIREEPIMPAAGFLEMGLEFGATALMNVKLHTLFSLSSEIPVKVDVDLQGSCWSVKSRAIVRVPGQVPESSTTGRLHADGYLTYEDSGAAEKIDILAVRERCNQNVTSADFYKALEYFSSYGPHFQRVSYLYFNFSEALASIQGLDDDLAEDGTYILHPAILDTAFQATAYRPFHGDNDPNSYYLPAAIKSLVLHRPNKARMLPSHIYAYLQVKKWTPDSMVYDIFLIDSMGLRLCSLFGFEVVKHRINPLISSLRPWDIILQSAEPLTYPQALHYAHLENNHKTCTSSIRILDASTSSALGTSPSSFSLINKENDLVSLPNNWEMLFKSLHVEYKKDQLVPSRLDGSCLDEISLRSSRFLRTVVELLSNDCPRRVLRICVGDGEPRVLSAIQNVMQDFPFIFCEVICVNPTTEIESKYPRIDVLRSAFDVNGRALCDIAIAFNFDPSSHNHRRGHSFRNLLIPGGILIVAGQESATSPDNPYILDLVKTGYTVMFSDYLPIENPFYFLVVAQITVSTNNPLEQHSSDLTIIHYRFGDEAQLQMQISLLPPNRMLRVFVIVDEGLNGGFSKGLARVLRREYPAWSIRLIIFPRSVSKQDREAFLHNLPKHLEYENELTISSELRATVPRLIPLQVPQPGEKPPVLPKSLTALPPNQVTLQVVASTSQGDVSGYQATVLDDNSTSLAAGATVIGLVPGNIVDGILSVDVDSVYVLNDCPQPWNISRYAPGFVVAAIAPGISLFRKPLRLSTFRILITNSDTELGLSISYVYSTIGVPYSTTPQSIRIIELAQLDTFDLIISGYDDVPHIQILKTILTPRIGKLFLWNDKVTGLGGLLTREPISVSDALHGIEMVGGSTLNPSISMIDSPTSSSLRTSMIKAGSSKPAIRQDRVYVLLGGLGNLGIHIALLLYKHGARHIVLTSRSGEDSIRNNANIILRRMIEYLKHLPGLNLRLEAVDATIHQDMEVLISSLDVKLAGCFILTATIRDKTFQAMSQVDLSAVFSSKVGVLEVLKDVVDLPSIDFVIAFSSVSGTFGFGGQSNYAAANTALEEAMTNIPNGFTFICPGILDTSLVLANGTNSNNQRLRENIPWSITAEEMIRWLEHAMFMFMEGHKFTRYLPNLDWDALDRSLGMPQLGRHVLREHGKSHENEKVNDEFLTDIVRDVLGVSSDDFSPEIPLTSYGMDSLSASKLSFSLRSLVEVTQMQLLADMSLNDLRLRLESSRSAELPTPHPTPNSPENVSSLNPALEMLNKYMLAFVDMPPSLGENTLQLESSDQTVLLTGSTGSLGCNILHHLLQREDVKRVYAFNRRKDDGLSLHGRQEAALRSQGLSASHLRSSKLVMIEGVFTQEDFGLSNEVLFDMRSTVTHIIHNAWRVELFKPLSNFEDLILGTKHLINFALHSLRPSYPSLSFISSIAVFHQMNNSMELAPETPLAAGDLSRTSGYIQSKWISERLCQIAAERTMLKTNVIRVGLLTGGLNGFWDQTHWFPSLVHSATEIGCLPDGDQSISWIPSYVAAAAVIDMRTTMNETLHLIHPHPVPWSSILKPLSSAFNVPLVPYDEWFARLEHSARQMHNKSLKDHPALKLIDFFRFGVTSSKNPNTESMGLLPKVAHEKGLQASPTLADERQRSLGIDDVKLWLHYWRKVRFLP